MIFEPMYPGDKTYMGAGSAFQHPNGDIYAVERRNGSKHSILFKVYRGLDHGTIIKEFIEGRDFTGPVGPTYLTIKPNGEAHIFTFSHNGTWVNTTRAVVPNAAPPYSNNNGYNFVTSGKDDIARNMATNSANIATTAVSNANTAAKEAREAADRAAQRADEKINELSFKVYKALEDWQQHGPSSGSNVDVDKAAQNAIWTKFEDALWAFVVERPDSPTRNIMRQEALAYTSALENRVNTLEKEKALLLKRVEAVEDRMTALEKKLP